MSVSWQYGEPRNCQSQQKLHEGMSTFYKLDHLGHELTHLRNVLLVRTRWVIPELRDSFFGDSQSLYRQSFLLALMRCEMHTCHDFLNDRRHWNVDSLRRDSWLIAHMRSEVYNCLDSLHRWTRAEALSRFFPCSEALGHRKTSRARKAIVLSSVAAREA